MVQIILVSARTSKLRLKLALHSLGSRSVLPYGWLPRAAPTSCLHTRLPCSVSDFNFSQSGAGPEQLHNNELFIQRESTDLG